MLTNIFNKISSVFFSKPEDLAAATRMVNDSSVSNILNTYENDKINLLNPQSILAIPANSGFSSYKSPVQQIMDLGKKYNIPFSGNIETYQTRVVKAAIMHKAMQLGVPLNVALGIGGNESGWKMWSNTNSGKLIEGKNVRGGVLSSTDWGAMQINDKAHPKAFPRAKYDLEYNIDYGLNFLSKRNDSIKGNLGLGFGDWDRTIASYNLGHNPNDSGDYAIANKYVSHVKQKSLKV